jgi:hypothetical protein
MLMVGRSFAASTAAISAAPAGTARGWMLDVASSEARAGGTLCRLQYSPLLLPSQLQQASVLNTTWCTLSVNNLACMYSAMSSVIN